MGYWLVRVLNNREGYLLPLTLIKLYINVLRSRNLSSQRTYYHIPKGFRSFPWHNATATPLPIKSARKHKKTARHTEYSVWDVTMRDCAHLCTLMKVSEMRQLARREKHRALIFRLERAKHTTFYRWTYAALSGIVPWKSWTNTENAFKPLHVIINFIFFPRRRSNEFCNLIGS